MLQLPQWKKSLAAMWFAQLAGMGAISGAVSFLPLYISRLGITSTEETELWAGILVAVAPLFAALSGPHWGALGDRHGRKIMTERVMFVMIFIIGAMAFVTNVYQLFALRLLQGLFGGFTASAIALVTSISPPDKISFTLGFFQTAMIAGGAFGPMFGGVIADAFGYNSAFIAFSLLSLLALFIIHMAVVEDFTPAPTKQKVPIWTQIRGVLAVDGLKAMLFIMFLIQFGVQAIVPVLPLYVQSLAPNSLYLASICGGIIAITGLTSALASASISKLTARIPHRCVLIGAAFFAALTFASQALATNVWALGVARGFSGLFMGAMLPTINTLVYLLIPAAQRGISYGVTSSAALLGSVLGPLSSGLLALQLGTKSVFWLTALLFAAVCLWSFTLRTPQADNLEKTAP